MKTQIKKLSIISGTVVLLGLTACSSESDTDTAERDINLTTGNEEPAPGMLGGTMANDYRDITVEITPYATVEFNAADGSRTSGNMQFVEEGSSVRIFGRLANLPQGTHGVHILQTGDCTEVTGVVSSRISGLESAAEDDGAALPDDGGFIGNISVGADSLAQFELVAHDLMLEGTGSIIGKPVIIGPVEELDAARPGGAVESTENVIACGVIALNDVTAADQN